MSKGQYRPVQANKRHRDILGKVKNELDVQYARIRTEQQDGGWCLQDGLLSF